jgi:hypothetical protein
MSKNKPLLTLILFFRVHILLLCKMVRGVGFEPTNPYGTGS